VTNVTARPNQTLTLPSHIQTQPNDIENIRYIAVNKHCSANDIEGILYKNKRTDGLFNVNNPVSTEYVALFSLRSWMLQLNLNNSFYNCMRLFHISIAISVNDHTFTASYRVMVRSKSTTP